MSKLVHPLPPVRRETGACWLVDLTALQPVGTMCRAKLFEDGRPLGPSNAIHEEIRQKGGGRYSYWNGSLFFSTSDGTDPGTNGRNYTVEIESAVNGVFGLPRILHINPTDACNLTCRMCRDHNRGRSTLSDSILHHLIHEVMPCLDEVRIDSTGEAFLHRRKLHALLEAAGRHNVSVFMSTNGTLVDEEIATAIATTGVPFFIQVSLDSPKKDTFEWIRRGGCFEDAIAGLRHLVAARDRYAPDSMRISLHPALFDWNVHQTVDTVRLAHQLGVDQVTFQFGSVLGMMEPSVSLFWDKTTHDDAIDRAVAEGRRLGVMVDAWGRFSDQPQAKPQPCVYLYDWSFVSPNGHVAPCCISSQFSLGDLKDKSFPEIWNGDAYTALRATYETDQPTNPNCRTCHLRAGWDRSDYRSFFDPVHWPAVRRRLAELG